MVDIQSASKMIIGLNITFFLLLGLSLLFVEPGSGSYVVAQLALVPIVVSTVASAAVIYFRWTPFK
ncbi:hypothetical protein [Haloarchaeobius sp. TZWSO28]|uniref:hypothetical protein n=1 Tax=unclassified Haloarchaeobius TaxID=2614452 RepID=UPI003EBF8F21